MFAFLLASLGEKLQHKLWQILENLENCPILLPNFTKKRGH